MLNIAQESGALLRGTKVERVLGELSTAIFSETSLRLAQLHCSHVLAFELSTLLTSPETPWSFVVNFNGLRFSFSPTVIDYGSGTEVGFILLLLKLLPYKSPGHPDQML